MSYELNIAAIYHGGARKLVCTDIRMPGMNGPELADLIRSRFPSGDGLQELRPLTNTSEKWAKP